MPLVVDSSVIVKLIYPEKDSNLATAIFGDARRDNVALLAPTLTRAGVVNVIRREMLSGNRMLDDGLADLDLLLALPIQYLDLVETYPQALKLTRQFSLSLYDALYIALAQQLGCEFWTADERIVRALNGRLLFVRLLATYTA